MKHHPLELRHLTADRSLRPKGLWREPNRATKQPLGLPSLLSTLPVRERRSIDLLESKTPEGNEFYSDSECIFGSDSEGEESENEELCLPPLSGLLESLSDDSFSDDEDTQQDRNVVPTPSCILEEPEPPVLRTEDVGNLTSTHNPVLDRSMKHRIEHSSMPRPYNYGQYCAIRSGKRLTPFPQWRDSIWLWRVNSMLPSIRFNQCFWILWRTLEQLSEDSSPKERRFAKQVFGTLDPISGLCSEKFTLRHLPQWHAIGMTKLIRLAFRRNVTTK
jgi:hypothetical protein